MPGIIQTAQQPWTAGNWSANPSDEEKAAWAATPDSVKAAAPRYQPWQMPAQTQQQLDAANASDAIRAQVSGTPGLGAATNSNTTGTTGIINTAMNQPSGPGAGAGGPAPIDGNTQNTNGAMQMDGVPTSTASQPAGIISATPAVNTPDAMQQMKTDWGNAFKPGTGAESWGGGQLGAVDAQGNRVFTNASGKQTTINANTNMEQLARDNQGVAAQWGSQYGYNVPNTQAPSANGQAVGTGYDATKIGDPTKWAIDPSQTVSGQLSHLTDPNDPLNVQANTRAMQEMNAHGLMNSSLAVSAGQDAILKNAMPIAQADAAAASKAAGYNADQQNQVATANAGSANQAAAFTANAGNVASNTNLGATVQNHATDTSAQTSLSNAQTNFKTTMANSNLDSSTKLALQSIDANTKGLMQTTQSGQSLFNQAMISLQAITSNKDMSPEYKQTATDQIMQGLQNSLHVIGKLNNVDITGLLNFGNMPGSTAFNNSDEGKAAADAAAVKAAQEQADKLAADMAVINERNKGL